MEKLKVGIIGCGGIANGKHMPALKKLDNVEMVAFCDIIPERAEKAAKDYGTADAKVYTDYKELLKDESIHNVRILTPNRWHAEMSIAALKAGKHVMCEKPMATSYADALKMIEARDESGKVLTIGYQHKFDADVRYARQEAQKGTFGDIYFAKASILRRRGVPTWGVFTRKAEQGGGALIDVATHSLDMVLHIMGNYKPKMLLATTYDKLKYQKETGNAFGPWDVDHYDVEESAFAHLVMENGATIVIEASWALNTSENCGLRFMVCGDKAGADNYNGKFKINGVQNDRLYILEPDLKAGGANVSFFSGIDESPTVAEQQVFLNATLGKGELITTPETAAVVTRILEAIYISAQTGKPYFFD